MQFILYLYLWEYNEVVLQLIRVRFDRGGDVTSPRGVEEVCRLPLTDPIVTTASRAL